MSWAWINEGATNPFSVKLLFPIFCNIRRILHFLHSHIYIYKYAKCKFYEYYLNFESNDNFFNTFSIAYWKFIIFLNNCKKKFENNNYKYIEAFRKIVFWTKFSRSHSSSKTPAMGIKRGAECSRKDSRWLCANDIILIVE